MGGIRRQSVLLLLLLCLVSCGANPPALPADTPGKGAVLALSRLPAASPGPNVRTDWSRLTPYEPPALLYTRYHGDYTDHLLPRPDYGPLVPFAGQGYTSEWGETIYAYGLATAEGKVVVDPVYTNVRDLECYDYEAEAYILLPVLVLTTAANSEAVRYSVAARDGSWVLEGEYADYEALNPETFWVRDEDWHCRVFDTGGTLLREYAVDLEKFPVREEMTHFADQGDGLWFLITPAWVEGRRQSSVQLLDAFTGEAFLLPGISDVLWLGGGLLPAQDSASGLWGYLERDLRQGPVWAVPPLYTEVEPFRRGCAQVTLEDGRRRVIDPLGRTLLEPEAGDLWRTRALGEPIFVFALHGRGISIAAAYDKNWEPLDDLFYKWIADTTREPDRDLLVMEESGRYRWAGEEEIFSVGGHVFLQRAGDCLAAFTNQGAALLDRRGRELIPQGTWETFSELTDPATGTPYILASPSPEEGGPLQLLDRTGTPLFTFTNDEPYYGPWIRNGLLQYREGDLWVLRRLDGEILLRCPLTGVAD